MTTSTPILGLTLYDSTTDQAVLFADFRAGIAGTPSTSNFYKIDTAIGTIQTNITSLQATRGAVPVNSTYSAPNTYIATAASISAYTVGLAIMLSVDTTTSGTTTLNINSLGAKSLMKVNSSGTAINLTGSDLGKGGYYLFMYDGTRFLWVSANSADQIHIVGTVGNLVTINSDNTLLGTTTQAGMLSSTTNAATSKSTPVDADEIPVADSAASYALKKFTLTNLWTNYLKAKADALYALLAGSASQVFSVGTATALAHAPRTDQIQTQGVTAYTTGGTSTAYTLTTLATGVALTTNERWAVTFHTTAGATPTLNRDSKGAKSLKYYDYSGTKQSCSPTTILSGMKSDVIYDGTDYVVLDVLIPNIPTTTALSDFQVGDGSGNWVKKTLAETKAIIQPGLINGQGGILTISSGSITPTHKYHQVDTESGAATDDLTDIVVTNAEIGDVLILSSTNAARDIVIKDGSGTIRSAGDFTLATTTDTFALVLKGAFFAELSRSTN